ncbi:MAG TPA: ATP-binding protein, partial [Anaerolineae bacterium]|nr:ATP-binding protein [Anaerolineae bacterium]
MTNYSRLRSNELRYSLPVRWLLAVIAAFAALRGQAQISPVLVVLFAAFAAATTIYFLGPWSLRLRSTAIYWAMQVIDAAFVTGLIATSGGLASPLYLLYPLLGLRTLVYGPDVRGVVWLPFAFGPLYFAALVISYGNLAFVADPLFLTRYLLLLALVVGIVGAGLVLANRLSEVDRLRLALAARTEDLANQARALQRTANDLGDRVLELRTLQEVAKALSATLYLNETLTTVANRLSRLSGSPYCAVALLDEERTDIERLVVAAGSGTAAARQSSQVKASFMAAMVSGRHQVLRGPSNGSGQPDTEWPIAWPVGALEVIPLVARGAPIGALLVGHSQETLGDSSSRSLTESFAYFAATAIENARLYGDVTDRHRELEAVLAGIGDGVIVVDSEAHLLLMNPVAARVFGLSSPPLGVWLADLSPGDDVLQVLEETATSGLVVVRELPIASAGLGADGQPRTFQALAAPLFRPTEAGEEVSGVVTVLRDISAQKELERMKSNFLSVVSHELKTPLHSIKGFVDIFLMGKTGPVTELQRDFLTTVKEQTGHLQRLIEDLLEFSRLESGQIRLRPLLISPAEIVASVADKLTPLASNKGLSLALDVAGLPEIEADPMRLEQVLTNLVENAIKFTPDNGLIRVTGSDGSTMIELVVADSGIGVPAEERERIFDRFYQVDSSARRRYKGTGLGLTICKHIVTQHGGRIWVEAVEGGGSAFHVLLPKMFPVSGADPA